MSLIIYAVIVTYKQSGQTYVYLAYTENEAAASALVIGPRQTAIGACYAAPWPDSAPMPRVERIIAKGTPHSFRIGSRTYADNVIAALGYDATRALEPIPAHRHRAPARHNPGIVRRSA